MKSTIVFFSASVYSLASPNILLATYFIASGSFLTTARNLAKNIFQVFSDSGSFCMAAETSGSAKTYLISLSTSFGGCYCDAIVAAAWCAVNRLASTAGTKQRRTSINDIRTDLMRV